MRVRWTHPAKEWTMGLIGRLFGRDSDSAPVITDFDSDRVRPEVDALIGALGQLADAMDRPDAPISNPGWRGRLRDLRSARADLRLLTRHPSFSRDDLFEVLTTVRPLYRGDPPAGFDHLDKLNALVTEQIETVHRTAAEA